MGTNREIKLGRKLHLGNYKNLELKVITVNYYDFKTLYLDIQGWLRPIEFDVDHEKILAKATKKIKQLIHNLNNEYFKKESIVVTTLHTIAITPDKDSFFGLEVYFYINKYFDFKTIETEMMMKQITKRIIDECLDNDDLFNFVIRSKNKYKKRRKNLEL